MTAKKSGQRASPSPDHAASGCDLSCGLGMQVVQKRHKHDSGKPWPAYSPCSCAGACDAACPCLKSKNFCEKFCGCSPAKCGIRFQGCDCKSGCRSKTCPCFAAGVLALQRAPDNPSRVASR